MKKIIGVLSGFVINCIIIYSFVTYNAQNTIQNKVTENHGEIENILTINRIGSWGEWFSEYVLVVEIDGEMFRIWVNHDSEIVEKEVLRD